MYTPSNLFVEEGRTRGKVSTLPVEVTLESAAEESFVIDSSDEPNLCKFCLPICSCMRLSSMDFPSAKNDLTY